MVFNHLLAVVLVAAGYVLWRVRRRRRHQPAGAAVHEAGKDGKPSPDLEAGWTETLDKGAGDKQQQLWQQQRQRQHHRVYVDSAATSASESAAAASTPASSSAAAAHSQEAAPDGLEGLAALWAQAAQAAVPAAAAPDAAAAEAPDARAVAAGAAGAELPGQQPQDSAYRGGQAQPSGHASGPTEAADGSSPVVAAAGSAELAAPGTPAGELPRGASRRSSQGLSLAGSAGMDLDRWEVDFSAISLVRLLGEGSCGSVYLATLNETAVAVKLLAGADPAAASAGSWRSSPALQALHKESSLMASLRHPNVVSTCLVWPVCALVVSDCDAERGSS